MGRCGTFALLSMWLCRRVVLLLRHAQQAGPGSAVELWSRPSAGRYLIAFGTVEARATGHLHHSLGARPMLHGGTLVWYGPQRAHTSSQLLHNCHLHACAYQANSLHDAGLLIAVRRRTASNI